VRISVVRGEREARLAVEGDIDHANAHELTGAFRGVLHPGGGRITLDFSEVTYVDSAGVCAIHDMAHEADGRQTIEIVEASPQVQRILRFAGLGMCEGVHLNLQAHEQDPACQGVLPGLESHQAATSWASSFPSRLDQLGLVRAFVEKLADRAGLAESRTFDLKVAVSEASANAIEHGLGEGDLRVTGVQNRDRLTITVCHPGDFRPRPSYDPAGAHRGMGLPLMFTLTDEVTVACSRAMGTSVSLSVLLHSGGE